MSNHRPDCNTVLFGGPMGEKCSCAAPAAARELAQLLTRDYHDATWPEIERVILNAVRPLIEAAQAALPYLAFRREVVDALRAALKPWEE